MINIYNQSGRLSVSSDTPLYHRLNDAPIILQPGTERQEFTLSSRMLPLLVIEHGSSRIINYIKSGNSWVKVILESLAGATVHIYGWNPDIGSDSGYSVRIMNADGDRILDGSLPILRAHEPKVISDNAAGTSGQLSYMGVNGQIEKREGSFFFVGPAINPGQGVVVYGMSAVWSVGSVLGFVFYDLAILVSAGHRPGLTMTLSIEFDDFPFNGESITVDGVYSVVDL